MRFENGCNRVVTELCVVKFLSEIIVVTSSETRAARPCDFGITRMISDQIALYLSQLYQLSINPVSGLLRPDTVRLGIKTLLIYSK